jgi:tetratricopeptide (TPR) repeat protein
MCGGDIHAVEGQRYGVCDHCRGTMTLPNADDERRANLFNRANHFRRQGEFDKAIAAYESILNEDNSDAEAHWGVVLCRYGIEYVEDPVSHERVPTCRRARYESVLSDADTIAALENAPDGYTRGLYEKEAQTISEMQKGILAISQKEQGLGEHIAGISEMPNYKNALRFAEAEYRAALEEYARRSQAKRQEKLSSLRSMRKERSPFSIAAGYDHTVGLRADGSVVAAGHNDEGQCDVSNWRDIAAVAAGEYHTVGLRADGTVVAVGWNDYGQCNVSDWRDIGVNPDKIIKSRQTKKAAYRKKT